MVKYLEIHDLPESGQLQVARRNGGETQAAPPVDFHLPLEDSDRGEIAWYFQEYLDYPFGTAVARADAVETGLRNLGRLLFERTFGGSEAARSLFGAAMAEGLAGYQLAIVSSRPEFLTIPWELLNSSAAGYVTSELSGLVRQTEASPLPSYVGDLVSDQLNVLLVAPRPAGNGPRLFGGLAAATVAALESLDVQVSLDFVRPASFAALEQALSQKPGCYHVVQLDGVSLTPEGEILLEGPDSLAQPVPAAQLAGIFNAAAAPVVLFTAGDRGAPRAGAVPAWMLLGMQMSQAGMPATVLLPHCLHGAAAGEDFARRFYQALARGQEVAAALKQARSGLMETPRRPTLTGPRPFWDWTIPALYQTRDFTPPAIEVERPNPLARPMVQNREAAAEGQFPAAGQYGLVGRQAELADVERLLRNHPVTLLSGNTGAGKTELALGLARWLQKTGRPELPGGVFYTPFDVAHPASLERVIHEIGTAIAGLGFADLTVERQRSWVVEYLKEQPSLLIWDGVENIAGFPPGTPGLLNETEQAKLADFLAETVGLPASRALLVTRNSMEPWLTIPAQSYVLKGLESLDRRDLAGLILEKNGVATGALTGDVIDLLDAIEGHPLACQIALPLLKNIPAPVILGELQRRLAEFSAADIEAGRDDFLTALMEYSWSKMPYRSRTHLPFLSLFQRRVMMDILTHITQEQVYRNVMNEELGWGACRTLLRSALADGFLEPVSPSVYQIHPALPRFLGAKLGQQASGATISRLESEFVRVYADTADYFMESLYENQDSGVTAVLAEEGNLHQALALALEAGQWDNAQLLLQPLAQVYRMQKRIPELRRLREQLLEAVGQTAATAEANGSIDLWLYLLGTDVSESVDSGYLARAEGFNRQLMDYLSAQPQADTDPRLAAVYHQFGMMALLRRQLDEAAGWLQRSLSIIEDSDDRAAVADDYFALGQVRQRQRYYTEAREWYSKALEIHQRLPDAEEMVKDYRALGLVTQLKFEHKEAESWYHRARELAEEHRDEETAALIYHELGTVCHAQYEFDQAKSWYQQALSLSDRQGNLGQLATELHFLGLLEQDRGVVYEEAEEWYLAALERRDEMGDRLGAGDECRQLGVLFHEQQQYRNAENWYHQAREIFEELGEAQRLARTYGQLGMVAEEQGNLASSLEWVARTYLLVAEYGLPMQVQVKAHLGRLRDKYGLQEFDHWWVNFTGEAAPTDLDVDTSGIL